MLHEVVHDVDPFTRLDWYEPLLKKIDDEKELGNNYPYLSSWHEFDAYFEVPRPQGARILTLTTKLAPSHRSSE